MWRSLELNLRCQSHARCGCRSNARNTAVGSVTSCNRCWPQRPPAPQCYEILWKRRRTRLRHLEIMTAATVLSLPQQNYIPETTSHTKLWITLKLMMQTASNSIVDTEPVDLAPSNDNFRPPAPYNRRRENGSITHPAPLSSLLKSVSRATRGNHAFPGRSRWPTSRCGDDHHVHKREWGRVSSPFLVKNFAEIPAARRSRKMLFNRMKQPQ